MFIIYYRTYLIQRLYKPILSPDLCFNRPLFLTARDVFNHAADALCTALWADDELHSSAEVFITDRQVGRAATKIPDVSRRSRMLLSPTRYVSKSTAALENFNDIVLCLGRNSAGEPSVSSNTLALQYFMAICVYMYTRFRNRNGVQINITNRRGRYRKFIRLWRVWKFEWSILCVMSYVHSLVEKHEFKKFGVTNNYNIIC